MKRIVGIAILVFFGQITFAQNEEDVLRFSRTDAFGSARFEAMAGSFGALGADFSSIQINPAGMGRFSSSRIAVSTSINVARNKSLYNEHIEKSGKVTPLIKEVGVVINRDLSNKGGNRKYGQFTLGYSLLNDYNNKKYYEGQNFYSLLDVLANDGAGISPFSIYDLRPFTTGLAYDVYAVDWDDNDGAYYSRLTSGDMYHKRSITSKGKMSDFHLGYSENYNNSWYWGISLGIRRINYKESYEHYEELLNPMSSSLRWFTYSSEIHTKGYGVNGKVGLIYVPMHELRFGLAFETPTINFLQDAWTSDMTAMHTDGLKYVLPEYVPKGKFDYTLRTPMKIRGSMAYILGLRGALNIDAELVRYQGGKLGPRQRIGQPVNSYNFAIENQEVRNQFRTVVNLRVGFEYMVLDNLFLRTGAGLLPSPYKKKLGNNNKPDLTFAGGIGWNGGLFYADIAYRIYITQSDYYAFDPTKIENKTEFRSNFHNIIVSFGMKFR